MSDSPGAQGVEVSGFWGSRRLQESHLRLFSRVPEHAQNHSELSQNLTIRGR